MNSNNNDGDDSGGKNTLSFADRKQLLERILKSDASKMNEEKEWNGAVKTRNPVLRSYTDVQTKPKRPSRFRRTFLSWMPAEDIPEKDNPGTLSTLDLGDHGDSTEAIVDQLIEKLRSEKLSSTSQKSEEMEISEYDLSQRNVTKSLETTASQGLRVAEINEVVDLVKDKPIQKRRKKSLRKIFSWISEDVPHEDPAESLAEVDGTNYFNSYTARHLSAEKSPCISPGTANISMNSSAIHDKSPIETGIDVLNNKDMLHDANIPNEALTPVEPPEYVSSPIANLPLGSHSNDNFPHSNEVKTPEEVIKPILDELIATEESYIQILRNGIQNYSQIFQRHDLPFELQGREYELFANIEDISKFHRDHLLPMFLENRESAKSLFEKLQQFVEDKRFHIYFLFTINKKRSMQLCATHKFYFQHLQTELGDRLGISSFLLQPIQRMARYPLLLTEIIKSLYKHKRCPLLTVCCHLEHKVTNLVKTINASECINDIVGIDMTQLFSTFRRFAEFRIFDYTQQRRYLGKLFLFDRTIIATEIVGDKLEFRVHYASDHLKIMESEEAFTLDYKGSGWDDCKCDFSGKLTQVQKWSELIQEILPPQTPKIPDAEGACEEDYYPRNYRRMGVFDVYDHSLARNYHCKIFLFEKCLTFTEVQENLTVYRGTYPFDQLGVVPFNDYFTLFRHRRYQQECDFRGHTLDVEEWSELLRDLAAVNFRRAGSFRKKFGNAMNALSPKAV